MCCALQQDGSISPSYTRGYTRARRIGRALDAITLDEQYAQMRWGEARGLDEDGSWPRSSPCRLLGGVLLC